jgi:hypothetical protein
MIKELKFSDARVGFYQLFFHFFRFSLNKSPNRVACTSETLPRKIHFSLLRAIVVASQKLKLEIRYHRARIIFSPPEHQEAVDERVSGVAVEARRMCY